MAKFNTEIKQPFRLIDPEDVLVAKGQSATLKCKVIPHDEYDGILKFVYKWYYNGSVILLNDTKRQLRENGSLLYIPKISNSWSYKLEGDYQCYVQIKDANKGLLSNIAKLKVAGKLDFFFYLLLELHVHKFGI